MKCNYLIIILCFYLTNSFSQKAIDSTTKVSKSETEKWIIEKLAQYQTSYEVLPPVNGNPRVMSTGYKYSFIDQFLIIKYVTMSGMELSCGDSVSIDITNTNSFKFMANDNIWIQANYHAIYHFRHCLRYDNTKSDWVPFGKDTDGKEDFLFLGFKTRVEPNIEERFTKAIEHLKSFYKKREPF